MKLQRKVLKNGLRILAVPMDNNPTVTVFVFVEAGSHYEKKEQNGISHFLEHMCFKGTSRRSSPAAIAHELDALGAQSNAFTSYEVTGYYAKAGSKHFSKVLDVIADLYLNPTVPAKELEKEKGVIIEEIRMYNDLPMRQVGELLDAVMYGDQPAGRSILGTEEIIRGMKRETFVAYRSKHYVPSATTVVVAGGIKTAEVFAGVERYFATLTKASPQKKPSVRDAQRSPNVGLQYKKSSQAHFQIGFRGISARHKDVYAMEVLKSVLGQGMSSRLFKKLREEMGVCYYVRAETEANSDHGKFVIASGVDIRRVELVLRVIARELKLLRTKLVPPAEFKKAQECLVGHLVMDVEPSNELAQYYGMQEVLHRPLVAPAEYSQKIKKVTSAQVRSVAKKLFRGNKANLAIIGPFKNKARFKKLLAL